MAETKESFKKSLMKHFWRIQQAQMVISIVFWSMTLTGIFYPYIRERFLNRFLGPENVLMGMVLLFLLVICAIMLFGYFYDKLQFWKEQQFVIIERNPYTSWKLNPVQSMWAEMWLATAKSLPEKTPDLEEKIAFYEAWIRRIEEVDPWAKEMRDLTYKFAMEGDDTVLKALAKNSAK